MGFEITAFNAVRMKAESKHGGTSNWVDVIVIERDRGQGLTELTLTVHFDGPNASRKADAYAAAINFADTSFHPLEVARELADV
jgi:hypothetical protein